MAKTKAKKATPSNGKSAKAENQNGAHEYTAPRLGVQKTYKLYIGGKFPRTESGRFLTVNDAEGNFLANICRGSRKDFRDAVKVARSAFGGWAARAHFNRSQILYRIAEMLESRSGQFVNELIQYGNSKADAEKEVNASIDRLVYYAGWADKYQQVFSSVNPVSSSHFNFSVLEPMGVIACYAPNELGLLGFVSAITPIICGGNTVVVLASETQPTPAISFAEVLNSSDVPGGVVNILTGQREELMHHFSTHMDVNAMVYCGNDKAQLKTLQEKAVVNVKRVIKNHRDDWFAENSQGPYFILDTQETKTTWHPIEGSDGVSGSY